MEQISFFAMRQVVELKFTVARLANVVVADKVPGPVHRPRLVLARRAEDMVTDRLLVTDEAIRVLRLGR